MNRAELQQLADDRVLDAQALLAASRWSGAYYLAGYAVECALKSCILAQLATNPEAFFGEKGWAQRCWTHDVEILVNLAKLDAIRSIDVLASPALGTNWQIVKDWNETSRYQQKTQNEAQTLFNAITDKASGVMQWIKVHW